MVEVHDMYNQHHTECMILDSFAAYEEYKTFVERDTEDIIIQTMKSGVPMERWDHLNWRPGQANSLFCASVATCKAVGGNPLIGTGSLMCKKLNNILQYVMLGTSVIINNRGGYFPVNGDMEIVVTDTKELSLISPENTNIATNTKYLVLENDPMLEPHAIKYMATVDPNFSHICYLRRYNIEPLTQMMSTFKENGGEIVYVYTTGLDVNQMFDYSQAIIDSNISAVEFEFNVEISDNILGVINFLKSHNIEVKYNEKCERNK